MRSRYTNHTISQLRVSTIQREKTTKMALNLNYSGSIRIDSTWTDVVNLANSISRADVLISPTVVSGLAVASVLSTEPD